MPSPLVDAKRAFLCYVAQLALKRAYQAKNSTWVQRTKIEFPIYQPYYAFRRLAIFKLSENSCLFQEYYKFLKITVLFFTFTGGQISSYLGLSWLLSSCTAIMH